MKNEVLKSDELIISRKWLEKLVFLVDKVSSETDDIEKHGWLSHLLGYVHSLDEYFKKPV